MECQAQYALVVWVALVIHSASAEIDQYKLSITPNATIQASVGSYVHANCTSKTPAPAGGLKWLAEGKLSGGTRFKQKRLDNFTVSLAIESIERSDAGRYKCQLIIKDFASRQISKSLTIWVTQRGEQAPGCSSKQFHCVKDDVCIFLQYRCDGKTDCTDDSDEFDCGGDPCAKKYHCPNGRCIDRTLVCDQFHNNDCGDWSDELCLIKVHLPDTGKVPTDKSTTSLIPQPEATEGEDYMTWLKTTVYTVIACTVGVVLFISIIVIAVFRVKMKRAAARRAARALERRRHYCHREYATDSLHRLSENEPFIGTASATAFGNIFVNVNNGVQLVPGTELRTIVEAPPPYTEVVNQSSQRDGTPPPPYSTIDRTAQLPLLTNEAGTNTSRNDLSENLPATSSESGDATASNVSQPDLSVSSVEERNPSVVNMVRPVTASDSLSGLSAVNNVDSNPVEELDAEASTSSLRTNPESATQSSAVDDGNTESTDNQISGSRNQRSASLQEGCSSGNRQSLILNKQSQIVVKYGQIVLASNPPSVLAAGDHVSATTSVNSGSSGQGATKQRRLEVHEGKIILRGQDSPSDQPQGPHTTSSSEGVSQTPSGQIEVREGHIIFRT